MLLLKYVEHDGYEQVEGKFKDWDIKFHIGEERKTYEVKADRMAIRTGNFAIEYESRNSPSGIMATKADYWALFVVKRIGQDCYIIPTNELKSMIKGGNFREASGGDDYMNYMYLIPVEEFSKYLVEPEYDYEYA